jgi:hypothetical protein
MDPKYRRRRMRNSVGIAKELSIDTILSSLEHILVVVYRRECIKLQVSLWPVRGKHVDSVCQKSRHHRSDIAPRYGNQRLPVNWTIFEAVGKSWRAVWKVTRV